jgi:leucyl aminopeptidase (aminopeptidase T)
MRCDYALIAEKIVQTCAQIQEDHTIYIRGRKDCAQFCELIALACRNQKAYPLLEIHSDNYILRELLETPSESIGTIPDHTRSLIEQSDFIMYVGMQPEDPLPFRMLPYERIQAERLHRKSITDIILSHPEKRWIGIAYPAPAQASLYTIDFSVYHDMVWKAIDIDYRALAKRIETVASHVRGASRIHIQNRKGTDITLYIEDRPILKEDGIITREDIHNGEKICNLPTGEVYVAPHECESEGKAVFDFTFKHGTCCGVVPVTVSSGTVTPIGDTVESTYFRDIISHSTGDSALIGELGFGLNPCITHMVGHQLIDEKFPGSVHLALGENRHYGGRNQSDLHWDLVISQPTVMVDGTILIDEGVYCV